MAEHTEILERTDEPQALDAGGHVAAWGGITLTPPAVTVLDWHGCYDEQWGDLIVPDAFQHPAKFAKGLVERIVRHGLAEGYWKPGDLIGDPFGGIACGGIVAAYNGLRWVGVELEAKFVALGRENITLHAARLANLHGHDSNLPQLIQGDSRRFAEIMYPAAGVVTSPPYAKTLGHAGDSQRAEALEREKRLPANKYSDTPENIGNLRDGDVAGVVTSPPWENVEPSHAQGTDFQPRGARAFIDSSYGDSPGQAGKLAGETYWQAMGQVYRSVFAALKPGGVMACVVKDYIKAGQRCPLCDHTLVLLARVGFEPVARVRAWLVKETRTDGLFGDEIVERTERKSFFRRLYESKLPADSACRIDWEEVLFVRKPD